MEVLQLAKRIMKIPMVFDVFHHKVLPSKRGLVFQWMDEIKETWKRFGWKCEIHFSMQAENKKPGTHSQTIDVIQFLEFVNNIQDREFDIMLEVKDKNVSALKCMLVTSQKPNVSLVETEWGRYKYWLLEHSHSHYFNQRDNTI